MRAEILEFRDDSPEYLPQMELGMQKYLHEMLTTGCPQFAYGDVKYQAPLGQVILALGIPSKTCDFLS